MSRKTKDTIVVALLVLTVSMALAVLTSCGPAAQFKQVSQPSLPAVTLLVPIKDSEIRHAVLCEHKGHIYWQYDDGELQEQGHYKRSVQKCKIADRDQEAN